MNRLTILGDEGFRLFFPLAALHAALWPTAWAILHGLDMPLAGAVPPSVWHGGEMILGTFGAALIGFITTAVPEWTDTPRPQGKRLFRLAVLWGIGRLAGFLGGDTAGIIAAMADAAWLLWLVQYVIRSWAARPQAKLLGVLSWLSLLVAAALVLRLGFALGDWELAQRALMVAGLVFLGLLGLILARITVPITNIVLDPSRDTAPFRPHPGRINLAPGLALVAACAVAADLSPAITAYLLIAAGAAFLDRVAEAFVGREFLRTELLFLAGSATLSGAGLILAGAERLGAPFAGISALHVAFMGGLGVGVLGVFSIAGLMHSGRALPVPRACRAALGLMVSAVAARVLPELLPALPALPGPRHAVAALLWAAAFLVWLRAYWPFLSSPKSKTA